MSDRASRANDSKSAVEPTQAQLEECAQWLEQLVEDRRPLAHVSQELRVRVLAAAGRLSQPTPLEKRELRKEIRRAAKQEERRADERALARTGKRRMQRQEVFRAPAPNALPPQHEGEVIDRLVRPRNCYMCKEDYQQVHFFYDSMCPACGELNYRKRNQSADLNGRVALLTGGRVKIGFQIGLKLLRAGARVVVTTRFPVDAAKRYASEPDFEEFSDRLELHGLDLRHTPSVERLANQLAAELPRLDFIINNACQTVRRPPAFYEHLLADEQAVHTLSPRVRALVHGAPTTQAFPSPQSSAAASTASASAMSTAAMSTAAMSTAAMSTAAMSTAATSAALASNEAPALAPLMTQLRLIAGDQEGSAFPEGKLDQDLQQVDLRGINSWRLPLAEVSSIELLEVHLVNAVAPFIFNGRLKPLMMKHRTDDKHIVNVSAMEGQFYRSFKTDKHPHTNMAKAALNMMTRTSAQDYVRDGIHMNSVDTGWVTDEDPAEIAARKTEVHGFHPPLDIVDGAARVLDPIFHGVQTGEHVWGQFLKDYRSVPW